MIDLQLRTNTSHATTSLIFNKQIWLQRLLNIRAGVFSFNSELKVVHSTFLMSFLCSHFSDYCLRFHLKPMATANVQCMLLTSLKCWKIISWFRIHCGRFNRVKTAGSTTSLRFHTAPLQLRFVKTFLHKTSNLTFYYSFSWQLDWVCENSFLPTLSQSIFFCGAIVGGLLFGWIADRYGRIPALAGCNLIGFVAGKIWPRVSLNNR